MVIMQNNNCVKMGLPNGKVVDILSPGFDEIANGFKMILISPKVADTS